MIKEITTDQLRSMRGQEGLILQGCGGDLQEWLDGINQLLTEEGILLDGTRFESAAVFRCGGLTDLLLSFEDVRLDAQRLTAWREGTHVLFGGTMLSDFVPEHLGGFVNDPQNEMEGIDNGSQ